MSNLKSNENLIIRGAREHNLKNIDVEIPLNKLVVITGLSGSGKSTLAFDTIYAEGQRRYVESLSAYARQFLGLMNKPDVDAIHGLSPAISIDQKSTSRNPRSTVGTITEIYDYLRLLFARVGHPHCPKCGSEIASQSAETIVESVLKTHSNKVVIFAPVIRGRKGTYEQVFKDFAKQGFSKARVDGNLYDLEEEIKLDKNLKHTIEILVDRLKFESPSNAATTASKELKTRLQEAIETAIKVTDGLVLVETDDKPKLFSQKLTCVNCEINFEELQPRLFSFNSPYGACPTCHGLGVKQEFVPELIIPDHNISLYDGGVAPLELNSFWYPRGQLEDLSKKFKFDLHKPIKDLPKQVLDILLYGTDERIQFNWTTKKTGHVYSWDARFEGVIPQMKRFMESGSDSKKEELAPFMRITPCPDCKGQRLKPEALAVTINDKNIADWGVLAINQLYEFVGGIKLTETEQKIAKLILKEINSRLKFLLDVGLDYLCLSREAGTLSGGEAQRIRLATQIGSELRGVLYILDEPSIGLHQRDNGRLIATLKRLRDLGNTVLVVEHDEDTIMAADWVLDMGPGAGAHGGRVVAEGTPQQILKNPKSLTGQYIAGKLEVEVPEKRRKPKGHITLKGASENNLKNLDVAIPLGVLVAVTGVSGSGKSTLINDTLYKALAKYFYRSKETPGKHTKLDGLTQLDKVICIDQSPIGRTPRSNPATYIKAFDDIRTLFSQTPEAKVRGYGPGRFSFNVAEGRCGNCDGDGVIKIEMNFLPDVYVVCEKCKGKRYNGETLQITYKEKTIADVLDMTVEEGLEFFRAIPKIFRKIHTLNEVGLGYMKLGQGATTLSGGEAQRIKLTAELSKRDTGRTIYILDEPTTGLHFADVAKLLEVLNRLVEKWNTVLVIEHNLDVIKTADHIIDLGPEGGDKGGRIVAQGTPEEICRIKESYTGQFLKKVLK